MSLSDLFIFERLWWRRIRNAVRRFICHRLRGGHDFGPVEIARERYELDDRIVALVRCRGFCGQVSVLRSERPIGLRVQEIARRLGVHPHHVYAVLSGRHWKRA